MEFLKIASFIMMLIVEALSINGLYAMKEWKNISIKSYVKLFRTKIYAIVLVVLSLINGIYVLVISFIIMILVIAFMRKVAYGKS